nr:DUF2339 domain-containing protein [Sulfitobacter albidus]
MVDGGLVLSLLIFRGIEARFGVAYDDAHWTLGLNAAIWLGLALAQLQRMGDLSGLLNRVRAVLAGVFGAIGAMAALVALTAANPLNNGSETQHVLGPVLINTLAAAYLVPALVLLIGAWRLRALDPRVRKAIAGAGALLALVWGFATIRHFWQGGAAMPLYEPMSQPELYTYTVVLLAAGAALFYQSLARRAPGLRKGGWS